MLVYYSGHMVAVLLYGIGLVASVLAALLVPAFLLAWLMREIVLSEERYCPPKRTRVRRGTELSLRT
jgi:hypothetical protein